MSMLKYTCTGWQMTFNRKASKHQGEEPLDCQTELVTHLLKLCRLYGQEYHGCR